jgi:beta-glucosidase
MKAIQRSAQIAAREASADGINWTFSPMVDIAWDPRWGRMAEGGGEEPYLGGQMAKAMVRRYQGNDLKANNTIMSCIKHFALYGTAEAGRDYNTTYMSRQRMYNEYFYP